MMSDTLTLTSAVIVIVATLGAMFFHGPVMPNHDARKTFNPAMIFYPVMVGIWLVVAAHDVGDQEWIAAGLHVALAILFGVQGVRAVLQGRFLPFGMRPVR